MKRNGKFCSSILALLVLSGLGCTVFIPNEQPIAVRITDAVSGEELEGAVVILATDGFRKHSLSDLENDEYLEQFRDLARTTDLSGVATVDVESVSVCTNPILCDRRQDVITGRTFLALIELDNGSEILPFAANVSEQSTGEIFNLEVIEIGEPVPSEK